MIPVVRVKDGVKFDQIAPAGFRLLSTIDRLPGLLNKDVLVTCGTEAHPPEDPHSKGEAYDIGVLDMSSHEIQTMLDQFEAMGPRFYAQYELPLTSYADPTIHGNVIHSAQATGPHIHAQRARGTEYP